MRAYNDGMYEKTMDTRTAFQGKLLRVDVMEVELEDGVRSVREVVRHPGAAVILAQLPDGQFVFVRQYRKAVDQVLLEAVAGTLDPDEAPEVCARRELTEETGYTAETLKPLGTLYPAPGYSEEVLHVFLATLAPQRGAMAPDDDERITIQTFTREALEHMVANGALRDAKTLAAWMLYRSNS